MSIIAVNALSKKFRISKRESGLKASVKALFFPQYQIKTALDSVSFTINEGELVGYIGPNGAGKSTTIKILSGILYPSSGDVKVLGKRPWLDRIAIVKQIGVVFGQRTQLWWDLPVIESFELLKDIYHVPCDQYRRNLDHLVDLFELQKILHVPVRQLSLGQRMRCDIAASLLHSPKILFLDEPTIGLDAVSKLAVREFIRKLNKERQVTIILTTHDMDDIESLCQRVLILNEGKIFLDGSLDLLRKEISPERKLIVDLQHAHETFEDSLASSVKQEGQRVSLSYNPATVATPEMIRRITSRYAIVDLFVENPSIEEIIARLYREVNL